MPTVLEAPSPLGQTLGIWLQFTGEVATWQEGRVVLAASPEVSHAPVRYG